MTRATLGIVIAAVCSVALVLVVLATKPKPISNNEAPAGKTFTAAEVATHAVSDDCWTIVEGKVYDITGYISNHPGGSEILRACGKDSTELFSTRRENGQKTGSGTPHSSSAQQILNSLQIGTLTR